VLLIITVQFLFIHGSNASASPSSAIKYEISLSAVDTSLDLKKKRQPESVTVKKSDHSIELNTAAILRPAIPSSPQNIISEKPHHPVSNVGSPSSVVNGRLLATSMPWKEFVGMPYNENFSIPNRKTKLLQKEVITCPSEIISALAKPRLSESDFKWCQWALSRDGGKVVVGKSWGKLTSKEAKERFDALNCNSVNEGKNPSCDDSWGDIHIRTWQKNRMEAIRCHQAKSSDVLCQKNDNNDVYCSIKNAQINFSKMKKVSRGGSMTPSKKFQNDFLSADCKENVAVEDSFPFPHLYSPRLSTDSCDYVYNGTLLMYSHDDIRNLGHTLNDVFNIWIMLWMQGIARFEHQVEMLNIDSFKLGHNFDDQPNAFFTTYYKSLRGILKGIDFQDKTLCVKNLMVQPIPPRFFIWESWFIDLPCSFVGPSSLYQRWNLDVRNNYGLLNVDRSTVKRKVLLVVRNENSNMWGTQRTSRNYLNTDEIIADLRTLISEAEFVNDFELVALDLGKLSFVEQLQLIGEAGIMVGMHGAGMASSMHMSIGEEKCCGVLEMFPQGEFTPIKGHGNMVRKMGLYYDRLDIEGKDSQGNGAKVPVQALIRQMRQMMQQITNKPTCVIDAVIQDPFLEA
jgi:hypothetical protein